MEVHPCSSLELYNLLQAQKNWPSGGAPALLDLRVERKRIIRGSQPAVLDEAGNVRIGSERRKTVHLDRIVCVYHDAPSLLLDHAVTKALQRDGDCRAIHFLSESFAAFEAAYPFLCSREHSSKASKRPLMPSVIVPDLLYLGDLSDAAALPRLREQVNIQSVVTALAELPPSLQASVAEARVEHVWCNVRDTEEADIKRHFAQSYEVIERCRQAGTAVFVHCSRGVSRSATLCIAYLMKKDGMTAERARGVVEKCRPIILPNEGFWRCLVEFEKELKGERSGVYAPMPTKSSSASAKALDELGVEMPPDWAAPPTHTRAELRVEKNGETVEVLPVGEHALYNFGRSLTCDFPLEHASISRNHAALVHHWNGGLYAIDLKSSHGTAVNGTPLKPFEACLLKDGALLTFGASSRTYRLGGLNAAPPLPSAASAGGASAANTASTATTTEGPHQGPQLPPGMAGGEAKRKYTAQDAKDAKARKRQKALMGGSGAKMSENDRVAKAAGSGSGCMGAD